MAKLNERGHEILDDTPMAIPTNFKKPPSLQEMMARFYQASRDAEKAGFETLEDADDFDVGDDYDPSSPWELEFDPQLGKELPKDQKRFLDQERKRFDEDIKKTKLRKKAAPKPEEKPD